MSETPARSRVEITKRRGLPAVILSLSCWLAASGAAAAPDPQTGFPVALDGTRVRFSSVTLGDLDHDGLPEIVVGTADGRVHAYTGAGVELWTYDTGDMGIEGKIAIADVDGDGDAEVVVGAGSAFTPAAHGDLHVLSHTGALQCTFETLDTFPNEGWRDGVFSSPAVADLLTGDGGQLEIAFGGFDRRVRVIEHDCDLVWETPVFDAVWSSPAIGDIDDDGQLDVVIGVDSDLDSQSPEGDGGLLYVYNGSDGAVLANFPIFIDEVIWSSPALGDLTGDGRLEIVVGTGYCWASPTCHVRTHPGVGEYVNAWDHNGNALPGWPVPVATGTHPFGSPALADLDNDGELEVIINSRTSPNSPAGRVYALNADGSSVPGWPKQPNVPAGATTVHPSTEASPVVADLDGDGNLEVLLVSAFDLVVWDKDGNQLSRQAFPPEPDDLVLESSGPMPSSPAVGDLDGDGDLEVVIGSATDTSLTTGSLLAWDFGGGVNQHALAWPMFRHSADNRAMLAPGQIFADGFESGGATFWISTTSP